jgi:hypothetical protein
MAPTFGVTFLKGCFSLKNGTFCPLLATIQRLSSARAFLYTQKKSRMLCMSLTFTVARPVPTYLMKRTVERQLGIESGWRKS